jgi:PKHD-type hydroxylase
MNKEVQIIIDNHKIAKGIVFYTQKIPDKLVDLMIEELYELEKHENVEKMQNAKIGSGDTSRLDNSLRNSKLHWWYENHWACSIFSHYIGIANKNIWEYDLNFLQNIQVTIYNEGGHYSWHCDYGTSKDRDFTRKLSASLLLTDPSEYEGGDLEFVDYHNNIIKAPKQKGTMIVFDSRIPHRVTPLTMGKRVSLVTWMCGPKLR